MLEYKRLKQARLKQEAIRKARQRVLVDLPRKKFDQNFKSNPAPIRANNNWPNRNTVNTVGIRVTTKSKYTPVHGEK